MSHLSASTSPEVPSPRLVASWETLGLLPIERVPMWAAYWIVGGHNGEALGRLAGLHGDDPREVHDALAAALRDCGVEMPDSDATAAAVLFTHAARLYVAGQASPEWVLDEVYSIVTACEESVMDLPLGGLYAVEAEWAAGWGRSGEELTQIVREACEEQLRSGSSA